MSHHDNPCPCHYKALCCGRLEYLANKEYGLNLSEFEIALLISTIPNAARLFGSMIWGRIFDVVNFFSLRIVLNISFLTGTLAFFARDSWIGLALSPVAELDQCWADVSVDPAAHSCLERLTRPQECPEFNKLADLDTG